MRSTVGWRALAVALGLGAVAVAGVGLGACSGSGGKATGTGGAGGQAAAATPEVTAVGVPDPAVPPASLLVGPEGGLVSSSDGKVTVTIPPGALAAPTAISITPISNLAPGGVGLAYRLAPAGTAFALPVTLQLSYTDDLLVGSSADALAWATQDEAGRWHKLAGGAVDPVSKTLQVTSTHFSDWSAVLGFTLRPTSANVKVNETLTVQLVSCETVDVGDELATLLGKCGPANGSTLSGWAVNGTPGGNAAVGTITPQGAVAIYRAPGSKPAMNPVRVSAEVPSGKGKTLVFSNLTIISGATKWSVHATVTPAPSMYPDTVDWIGTVDAEYHTPGQGGTSPTGPGITGTLSVMRAPPASPKPTDCTTTVDPPAQVVTLDDVNTLGVLVISDDIEYYSGSGITGIKYSSTYICPNNPPLTTADDGDPITWLAAPLMPRTPGDLVVEGTATDPGSGAAWTWTIRQQEE